MASKVYPHGVVELMGPENYISSVIKIMLVDSGYTYNPDHKFVSDLDPGSNEIVAANYEGGHGGAGRKILQSRTLLDLDAANDRRLVDAADVTWQLLGAPAGGDPVAGVVFIEKASDAESILVAYLDPTTDPIPNGADFTYQFDVLGLFGVGA